MVSFTDIKVKSPGDVAPFVRATLSNLTIPGRTKKGDIVGFTYECKKCNRVVYKARRHDWGPPKLSTDEWRKLVFELGLHYLSHHKKEAKKLPASVKKRFKDDPEFK